MNISATAKPTPTSSICIDAPAPTDIFPRRRNYFAVAHHADGAIDMFAPCCWPSRVSRANECWSYCELPDKFFDGGRHGDYASRDHLNFINCTVQHGMDTSRTTYIFAESAASRSNSAGQLGARALVAVLAVTAIAGWL